MQTSLDDVAKKILASQYEMDQVKIIVPSIRAVNFLKESLKKRIDQPLIAPEIISISQFINELSEIDALSNLDLSYIFYGEYLKHTPKEDQEPFNSFYGWAPILLQEFNEIDNQLVNPEELFSFMNALGDIEQWGSQEKGELSKRHFKLQALVPKYYDALYKVLVKNQKGYSGLQLREAVKNLGLYCQSKIPHHFFVGFNALSKAEETIIQELMAEGKAEILWDLDQSFYKDPYHSAGHFIRQYYQQWNLLKREKPEFPDLFSAPKQIEIISTAKNNLQAKAAVQIASELFSKDPSSSTVIVLGDETLLQPTLSVLPQEEIPCNITMGYPLKETVLYSFFKRYFNLLENIGTLGYSYRDIFEFSKTACYRIIFRKSSLDTDQWIENYQGNYIPYEELCKKGSLWELMFPPFNTVAPFLERLKKITKTLKTVYLEKETEPLQIYACNRFLKIWDSILTHHRNFNILKSLADIELVFDFLIQQETFDFKGDPLNGIQIMGVLETRLLDFDNVIITNLNEGILPNGKTPFSWIPFDVRKKFEMNTFIEQDHLYAYHFYRLLQRAKKVFLLYNASAEGLFSGERSRFLVQLEYFKEPQHQLKFKQPQLPFPELEDKPKTAYKTQAVLDHLEEIRRSGFSPSSLTQYIRNPLSFYEQRMLKIQPVHEISNQLSAMDKGTIMHKVLEILYQPYLSQDMKISNYDKMLELLSNTLDSVFKSTLQNKEQRTGKNALVYQVMKEVLKQFLVTEKQQVSDGDQIKILALEHDFSKVVYVTPLKKEIQFKGTVDRIDVVNDTLRFVDYKTGKVGAADLAFSTWEEVRTLPKKNALFQVLMYSYLLSQDFKYNTVIAGVIPLKTFKNDFLAVSQKENIRKKVLLQIDESVLHCFEKELFDLINEIFDPSIAFQEVQ